MSDRTALLVIDMQIGLVEGAFRADAVLDRIADLIARARRVRIPVIHVQHHHATYAPLMAGAATWRLHPRVAPEEGERVTTCRRAISAGLHVTLVSDAHTTTDATLPAESIIAYHNAVLPKLAHPRHRILVRASPDVDFGNPSAP
jgi:nicotinamidase-related amidase